MTLSKILQYMLFIFIVLINNTSEKEKTFYKCGKNNLKMKPQPAKNRIPINHSSFNYKRKLDSDGFKKFNIYLDFTNIEEGIKKYNLNTYKNLFISSFNKAINTLQALLKVKPLIYSYYIPDEIIRDMGITYWDKSKFGDYAGRNGITTETLDIDLVIFGRFASKRELGEDILASAIAYSVEEQTGQPILGLVNINKDLDYSIVHSQEYFQSIILHEFTHILGFDIFFFMYYFNNLLIQKDKFGIDRYYINSTKVVNVAKKYFNCDNIKGVELENYGDEGTAGSHWEARILLGDYMNGVIYTEEQVISEFTLALLEDTGYYKANYYTGGLMRYGKNKGCDFLNEKCVNNYEINTNFENEFFDWFNQISSSSPSCSSGRQSRTYNLIWIYYNEIPEEYQYFNNSYYGGSSSADFCPVASNSYDEQDYGYYIGHCSNKGSGEYGSLIYYYDNNTNKTYYFRSGDLESIMGEKYSYNSFCYLSSLIKKNKIFDELILENTRAICFETFCSSKSLTIKIGEDFIVCPRAGGKIEVNDYEGYLLCPDYNLICSGTVLCNDMFDCVEKKSEIKEESYIYDYEIKTSQNIAKAEDEEPDNINNYELSEDGECPQYCKICTKNQKCLECKNNYILVGKMNEEKIKCVDSEIINIGHYRINDSFYYECIDNCDICSDSISCESCNSNSLYLFNKCIKKIENCKDYNEDGSCKICNDNFAFIENNRNECINIKKLNEYYSIDEGISYIKCNGENENHIKNCKKCHFNETLECDECFEDYYNFLFKCIKKIEFCGEYNENESCKKCIDNYGLIEEQNKCVNKEELKEYYSKDNGIKYYKCDGEGDNHIANCLKCNYNEGLKCEQCVDNNYILQFNKCIKKIENCIEYNQNNNCIKCKNGFAFIENDKTKCIDIQLLDNYYSKDQGINYFSCKGEGENHIQNCIKCHFNEQLVCDECANEYMLDSDNKKCIKIDGLLGGVKGISVKIFSFILLLIFYS